MSSRSTNRKGVTQWFLIAGFVVALTVSGVAAAQETTAGNESCRTDESPTLGQAGLYAEDSTIGDENGGRIAGEFRHDPAASCPVVVNVTLDPAAGVTVTAGSDIESVDNGTVQTQFVLEPGERTTLPAVDVAANGTGRTYVEGNVTYWPVDNRERSQSLAGLRVQFEAATPSPTTTEQPTSANGPVVTPSAVVATLLASLAVRRVRDRRDGR